MKTETIIKLKSASKGYKRGLFLLLVIIPNYKEKESQILKLLRKKNMETKLNKIGIPNLHHSPQDGYNSPSNLGCH